MLVGIAAESYLYLMNWQHGHLTHPFLTFGQPVVMLVLGLLALARLNIARYALGAWFAYLTLHWLNFARIAAIGDITVAVLPFGLAVGTGIACYVLLLSAHVGAFIKPEQPTSG